MACAPRSAPFEPGRAFFEEGHHAFLKVAALPARALQLGLKIKLLIHRVVPGATDRLFDGAIGLCRSLGQMGGARLPMRLEAFLADAFPDHAPIAGLPGADRLGKKGRPHRLGHAHLARQRSEEHTSALQSLRRTSYAVLCLTKKTTPTDNARTGTTEQNTNTPSPQAT